MLRYAVCICCTLGTVPAEWGEIVTLRDVQIGFNQLTGEIPSEWCNLPILETFDAQNLTGVVCYSSCFYSPENYTQGDFHMPQDSGACGLSTFLILMYC